MIDWADGTGCRREALLAYFDEQLDPAARPEPCCDNCREPAEMVDYTIPAQMYLSCAKRTRERFGSGHLIDVLRGAQTEKVRRFGHETVTTFGIGKDRPQEEWQYLARQLLSGGYAMQDETAYNAVKVTERGYDVLFRGEKVLLPRPRLRPARRDRRRSTPGSAAALSSAPGDEALFERLRALRKRLADERGVPPYVIFHDTTLRQMAAQRPATLTALRNVQGVGERKLTDYGAVFLTAIAEYGAPVSRT